MPSIQECYKILNLSQTASTPEVRQAYVTLVKRWHPDALQNRDNPSAAEKFQEVHTAYEILKQHLEDKTSTPTEPKVSPKTTRTVSTKISAEMLYESAAELGKKGLYKDAIAELSQAIRIDPNYAQAYQYRGHLNSILGLEYQAEADLSKAHILNTRGSSKTVADLERSARKYARNNGLRSKKSQGFKTHNARNKGIWAIAGLIIAGIVGMTVFQGTGERSPQTNPNPINFGSEAI